MENEWSPTPALHLPAVQRWSSCKLSGPLSPLLLCCPLCPGWPCIPSAWNNSRLCLLSQHNYNEHPFPSHSVWTHPLPLWQFSKHMLSTHHLADIASSSLKPRQLLGLCMEYTGQPWPIKQYCQRRWSWFAIPTLWNFVVLIWFLRLWFL